MSKCPLLISYCLVVNIFPCCFCNEGIDSKLKNEETNKLKNMCIDKWSDCTNDFLANDKLIKVYNDERIKVGQENSIKFEKVDLGVNLCFFTDNHMSRPVTIGNFPAHVILFIMTPGIYEKQSDVVKKLCRKVIGNVEFYYTLDTVFGRKDLDPDRFPDLKQKKDDANKYELLIKA